MEFTQGAPFDSFGLSEATMRAIRNKGYEISTPVQAGCIPPRLEGKAHRHRQDHGLRHPHHRAHRPGK